MINAHVVSLEMAKKLKEAGWKKESEFWWHYESEEYRIYRKGMLWEGKPKPEKDDFPAPLATEILEELPPIRMGMIFTKTLVGIWDDSAAQQVPTPINAPTLSNALAAMWIYLQKEPHEKG